MRVLVLGAYGLIGFAVVHRLLEAGHQVTGLGRSVAAARIRCPDADWVEHDIAKLTDVEAWLPILAEVDAVANCSGALQDSARDDLQAVQADAMKALFEACRRIGIGRVVQISATGASIHAATRFMRTKAEADAALMASDLDWIILRPGLVIAPTAYGATALVRALASFPGILPVVGGDQLVQTIGVHDVADAVRQSMDGGVPARRIYDLVEEVPHSLVKLVSAFRSWLGYPPAPVVRVPLWIGVLIMKIGDGLGSLGWRPPLRTTALREINAGVRGDPTAWTAAAGEPVPGLTETLGRLPSSLQERWFGRLWLLKPAIIATLSVFWFASGVIALVRWDESAAILTGRGISSELAGILSGAGAILDIALALLILIRSCLGIAAAGMIATTLLYLGVGTLLAPDLWLDPLGAFIKVIPAITLALVALAVAGDR